MKKENTQNAAFYKTKREIELEVSKHRREVLKKSADIYKHEKEELYMKFRLFQLHKWDILKTIKQKMLA